MNYQLKSIVKQKSKALSIFEDAKEKLSKALEEIHSCLESNHKKISDLHEEIGDHTSVNQELSSHAVSIANTIGQINKIISPLN